MYGYRRQNSTLNPSRLIVPRGNSGLVQRGTNVYYVPGK
jgi:hypothetical protein